MAALIKPTTLVRDPMILEQLRTALTVAHGVAVLVAGLQNHPMAEFYIPDAAIADGRIPVLRESTLTKATAEPTPSCCSMRRTPTRAWRSSRTTFATPLTFRVKGGGKLDRADTTTSQRWQTLDQSVPTTDHQPSPSNLPTTPSSITGCPGASQTRHLPGRPFRPASSCRPRPNNPRPDPGQQEL